MMKEYFIDLNGAIIKSYKSEKRALTMAQKYADNADNSVCVWCDHIVIWSNTEY